MKNFFLNKNLILILILSIIILSISINFNLVYCAEEVNNPIAVNPILDTPIIIQTTPRNMIGMLTNLGLSGISLYAGYYGIKSANYVNSIPGAGGTMFTKGALSLALFATGSFFGLGAYAISRRYGPSGPFVDIKIENRIITDNNKIPIEDIKSSIDIINSPLEESEHVFNPLVNINPLADNPDLALLSVSILMILFGIQCFNFILVRIFLIKNSSRILSRLETYPKIHKVFEGIILLLNKTYNMYVIGFTVLGYLNLIGGVIFLLFLLNSLTQVNSPLQDF